MKATDLMIGDWVVGCSGEPFKIGIIDPDFLHWNEIQPIPLTKEILEKNGFTHYEAGVFNDSFYFFAKDGEREGSLIRVWLYDKPISGVKILTKIETESTKGVGVNEVHNCDIEFVHELQHALRLCRIDKEIEL